MTASPDPVRADAHDAPAIEERGDTELNAAGFAAFEERRFAEAARLFGLAIAKNPGAKIYHNNAAAALMNQGRYEEAYRALERALELDPRFCKALSNMAVTCFHLGKYREAYGYYRRAREADSAYTGERFERGRVTEKLRRMREERPDNGDIESIYQGLKNGAGIPDDTGR